VQVAHPVPPLPVLVVECGTCSTRKQSMILVNDTRVFQAPIVTFFCHSGIQFFESQLYYSTAVIRRKPSHFELFLYLVVTTPERKYWVV
jgi:hypothetical protein